MTPRSRPTAPDVADDAGIGDDLAVLTPEGAASLAEQRGQVTRTLTTSSRLYSTRRVEGCQSDPEPGSRDGYRHQLEDDL